jgi:hypothetical protein
MATLLNLRFGARRAGKGSGDLSVQRRRLSRAWRTTFPTVLGSKKRSRLGSVILAHCANTPGSARPRRTDDRLFGPQCKHRLIAPIAALPSQGQALEVWPLACRNGGVDSHHAVFEPAARPASQVRSAVFGQIQLKSQSAARRRSR